ncbi:MAG: C4-type zinc ribbon domain-containing protein [Paludibacteraceae bacterium]|nr:C4-type zinc ribbon domain-containing protein [Paludibacteraceae bacterium]
MSETKDSKEISVEDKLRALYDLQLVASEIDKIKTLRGELPLEVQDLEDEIAGLNTRLTKYTEEIKEAEFAVSGRKRDIENAKSLIEKYKGQLDNVKNNREFENLEKEIEFQGLEIELSEKRIRESNATIKEKQAELEKVNMLISDKTMDLEQKKAELNEIVSETKQEEEKLREKAKSLEANIEQRLLTAFKRIRKNARNGLAVVYVQRDACGGCFNKIPPQRQMDIRLRKKVIVCEYCGRILIDPELADAEASNFGA